MAAISRARVLRFLGDSLLGMSIGLLAYYGLAALAGEQAQRELEQRAPWASVERVVPGPEIDFEGWAEEDLAYWESLSGGGAFARIVCRRMKLDAMVVKGSAYADLRSGPGWIEWTDLPGPTGNAGVAGHRTTFGAWFARIDRLERGDVIDVYSPFRRYRYRVTGTKIVTPDKVSVMDHTEEPRLTLSACHPPHSARYRFIAGAELVSVRRLEGSERLDGAIGGGRPKERTAR